MTRIDYAPRWLERRLGITPPVVAPAMRVPIVAVVAAVVLVAVLWAVQTVRLRAAVDAGAVYAHGVAAIEPDVSRVRALEADVARLRDLGAHIAALRRSGPSAARTIAALGDRMPDGVWLSALRADRGTLALEGRGRRLATIGTMLSRLATLPGYGAPRLVTAREDPTRHGVGYAIEVEPHR
ncbi:MAG: PilN domain-containing protein [Candidatus Eremiobacteraeota bacterium]|nr:PilN domain-containing protein [Candidatus Eremiobacteraeota bacterium]